MVEEPLVKVKKQGKHVREIDVQAAVKSLPNSAKNKFLNLLQNYYSDKACSGPQSFSKMFSANNFPLDGDESAGCFPALAIANHACVQNADLQPVMCPDGRIGNAIELISIKSIPKETEITIQYHIQYAYLGFEYRNSVSIGHFFYGCKCDHCASCRLDAQKMQISEMRRALLRVLLYKITGHHHVDKIEANGYPKSEAVLFRTAPGHVVPPETLAMYHAVFAAVWLAEGLSGTTATTHYMEAASITTACALREGDVTPEKLQQIYMLYKLALDAYSTSLPNDHYLVKKLEAWVQKMIDT
ncbi:hypothetical protein MBLNU459_g6190t1 [Dothideomycetes sp. NU459]